MNRSTFGLEPDEAKNLLLSVGTHRSDRVLSPVENGRLFLKMMSHGATISDCQKFVLLDGPSMVNRFIAVSRLVNEIADLVDWGQSGSKIGFTAAYELRSLPVVEQKQVVVATLEHQLSSSETRQVVQLRRRSGRDLEDCISEVVGMRPIVERRYVFLGKLDAHAQERLSELTASDRDLVGAAVISELLGVEADIRVGETTFTLVGSQEVDNRLRELGCDFEKEINEKLRDAT